MKTKLLIFSLFSFSIAMAQTSLSAGDIMFIGVNSDPAGSPTADEFAVLFLEPVTTGTEIYFTDMGYTGNTAPYFQQNVNNGCAGGTGAASDGIIKWTATSAVSAGSQLVIRTNITGVNGPTCNIGSVTSIVETQNSGTTISLSSAGEAIHAFQGTINGSNQVTNATMLTSLDYDAIWTSILGTCEFTSTKSENPSTGFEIQFASHNDNGYYTGLLTGDKATLQAAILNSSNWTSSSTVTYTFPLSNPLSTTKFLNSNEIKMYPNPSSGMVFIDNNVKKITIYDFLGKQMLETNENSFNIQSYLSGIYIVKIESEKGTSVKKLLKN